MLSVQPAWYWGGTSWLTFWLDKIGSSLNDLSQLNFYLIIPILCAYLINPTIKNLSSQKSLELSSKDAFVGSLATLGIVFICKYVKDLLFTSFPHYIDMNFHIFDVHNIFAASIPGLGLFLKIATETLLLFSFSIFFYHKFIEYSSQGKNIQKYYAGGSLGSVWSPFIHFLGSKDPGNQIVADMKNFKNPTFPRIFKNPTFSARKYYF